MLQAYGVGKGMKDMMMHAIWLAVEISSMYLAHLVTTGGWSG